MGPDRGGRQTGEGDREGSRDGGGDGGHGGWAVRAGVRGMRSIGDPRGFRKGNSDGIDPEAVVR